MAFANALRQESRETTYLAVGLAALAAFVVVAVQAWGRIGLVGADAGIAAWGADVGPGLRAFGFAMDQMGSNLVVLGLVSILALELWLAGRRRASLYLFAVFALVQVTVHTLKFVLGLPRPLEGLAVTVGNGFPSGHAANAALIATLLLWYGPAATNSRFWSAAKFGLAFLWVAAMGLGRIVIGAHYLSDVIGGALLGLGLSAVVLALGAVAVTRRVPVLASVNVESQQGAAAGRAVEQE